MSNSPVKEETTSIKGEHGNNATISTPSDEEGGGAVSTHDGQKSKNYIVPDGVDEKKLMRKIDFRLIPWLSVLYLVSFLDRSAIGNARLYGLENELKMDGTQFNIASAMFFITYALFEVPSNVLLKRLRPSVWFPLITVLVGICMLSQGVVSSFGGLTAARVCLGIVEAGLFPGVNYLLSGWYRREEFGLRAALFFSAATVSGAFGGLLSAGISNMDGVGNYSGWRWIFIIIGLATFVIGLMSIWLVEDFPDTAKFLTEAERQCVVNRLQADQKFSAAGEKFEWSNLIKATLDWKTWLGALAYMGADGPLYAFSIFTPTIVSQLGYTATRANLVSVPIYAFACLVTIGIGFLADRIGHRALINMGLLSVGIAGYIILATSRLPGLSYFAIYLSAAGIYPCIPNTVAFTSTSIEGAYKRAVVMAFIISFGNINGAATTNVYLAKDKPYYTLGHCIIILYLAIGFISSFLYYIGLRRSNNRKAKGLCDETILYPHHEEEASSDMLEESARQRADLEREESGIFAPINRLRRRYGEAPGGVYATINEAKSHKGDAYSGFVHSY